MIASLPSRTSHLRLVRTLSFLLVALVLGGSACASTPPPLPDDAARQLDVQNNLIADLTSPGAEEVPREALIQAALRAKSVGTDLRLVVAGVEDDLVSAESIVNRYGGTALSYKANDSTFEAASNDMTSDQLDRALAAAGQQADMGASASAFVAVLETEGLQAPTTSLLRWLLIVGTPLAALFMLFQMLRFWQARKRRLRRQRDFAERRTVLKDWIIQLQPEIEALAPLADRGSSAAQQTLTETRDFVRIMNTKLDEASSIGDLDMVERSVGRVAIQLRDVRRDLER